MKNLALALVVGILSVGTVSAQTDQKTKVKADKNEVKIKTEAEGRKGHMKSQDGKHKEHKSPEERAKHRTEKMTKELNLTQDQSQRVHQLNMQKAQQMQALKAKHAGADHSAMKTEMKTLRQNWNNDLKATLTAEQYAKYQAMQEERKAKMKDKKGKHGKGHGYKKGNK